MWGCSFLVLKGNLEFSQLKDEARKGKTWKGHHATGRSLMNTTHETERDDRCAVPSVPYLLTQ
jgi:hypothetical protein